MLERLSRNEIVLLQEPFLRNQRTLHLFREGARSSLRDAREARHLLPGINSKDITFGAYDQPTNVLKAWLSLLALSRYEYGQVMSTVAHLIRFLEFSPSVEDLPSIVHPPYVGRLTHPIFNGWDAG